MKILLRICNIISHSSKRLQTWDTLLNECICNNTRRPWQKIDVSQSVSLVNTLTTLERKKKVTTSQSNQGQHISEFRLFLFWENVFCFLRVTRGEQFWANIFVFFLFHTRRAICVLFVLLRCLHLLSDSCTTFVKKKIMDSTTESRPNKRATGRKNGFCRKQNFLNSLCMKVHRPGPSWCTDPGKMQN